MTTFFLKTSAGVNANCFNYFKKRFETFNKPLRSGYEFKSDLILLKFLKIYFPDGLYFLNKVNSHIFFLDLITCYRGWRHLKGLPCRGQRTWSNAWTSYRSNTWLRQFKFQLGKDFYDKLGGPEHKVALLSEYTNYLWKNQWHSEWLDAREFLRSRIYKNYKLLNIDLTAISKGYIMKFKKNTKVSKKKKKILTGIIGFDQGFTRAYFLLKYEFGKSKWQNWKKKLKKLKKVKKS